MTSFLALHSRVVWAIVVLLSAVVTLWLMRRSKRGVALPSWFLGSLDAKDRRMLLWCVGIAMCLAVAIGFLLPSANSNSNPLPSTYLSGQHGARAAYETLLRSNYAIERWERPLTDLAATAGPAMPARQPGPKSHPNRSGIERPQRPAIQGRRPARPWPRRRS